MALNEYVSIFVRRLDRKSCDPKEFDQLATEMDASESNTWQAQQHALQ